MSDNPSTRFFWNDWENEAQLRLCSLAAQGLWMRMLCLAARSNPVGYVVIDGEPCTAADLAKLVGESEETVKSLLNELERRKIFSRNRVGTIYNRRMVRQSQRAETNRENGGKGGRVSRDKKRGIFQSLDNDAGRHSERDDEHHAERQDEQRHGRPVERPPEAPYTPTSPTSPKPPNPQTPSADFRASAEARRVVAKFIELRRTLWPNEPDDRLVLLTLETQADQYLADGASEALSLEVIERVMRQNAAARKAPPSNLRFCRLSMQDAIAGARAKTAERRPDDLPSEPHLDVHRAQLESWFKTGKWPEDIRGPKPGAPGCRIDPRLLREYAAEIERMRGRNAA